MKKLVTITLALLMTLSLVACGNTGTGGQPASEPAAVKGETYDAGNVSALVPDGWKAFGIQDMWADEEGAMDPDQVQIAKGAAEDYDLFSKPSVLIQHYGADVDMMTLEKEMYDEGKDLEPLEIGGRTWNGFSAKSLGTPLTVLWTGEAGSDQFQVTVWTDMGDGTITLEDADVQAIIASIAVVK